MRMWEMLHQKRENPAKKLGSFASEEGKSYKNKDSWCNGAQTMEKCSKCCIRRGKSCEKPKTFGAVGPNMWKN